MNRPVPQPQGLDDFRAWLIANGWRVSIDHLRRPDEHDRCNWHAYKRSTAQRDCECNDKPPQLLVNPFEMRWAGQPDRDSCELSITGEANGVWFELKCYSLPVDEFKERHDEIALALVEAWEALA